jgi:hypothetical protein
VDAEWDCEDRMRWGIEIWRSVWSSMMHNTLSISTWDCANSHRLHHVLHIRFIRSIDRGGPDRIQTSAAHRKAPERGCQCLGAPVPGRHFPILRRYDVVIVLSRLPLTARQALAHDDRRKCRPSKPILLACPQKHHHFHQRSAHTSLAEWLLT